VSSQPDTVRVFLAVPPSTRSVQRVPDLGLGYLAANLTKNGHTVSIYQGERARNTDEFKQRLLAADPDLIGLKVYSRDRQTARGTISLVKSLFPESPIVLGGPHISVENPVHSLSYFREADYLLMGEAEFSLVALVDALFHHTCDLASIPGLARRVNGRVVVNPPVIHDSIDDFGCPEWRLIDPNTYPDRSLFWNPSKRGAPMITSRGCSYHCTFCTQNTINGKQVRFRSVPLVLEEMALLQDRYGVSDFEFNDDNFLIDPDRTEVLCRGILDSNRSITWACTGTRLDNLSLDLLKLMDRAGCKSLSVGYESGTQRILDYIQKETTLEILKEKTEMIARHSAIKINGLFILGYPTETLEDIESTIRFSLELPLFTASYSTYIPFPGCLEFDRLKRSGDISSPQWDHLDGDSHVYTPADIPEKTLKRLFKRAYWDFYSRPEILWRIVRYSGNRLPAFLDRAGRKWIWAN
jgi:radical SAM superfamily enzyme YgiQ (UPF0313 family)